MSQARSKTLSRFGFPDSVPSEPGDSYRLAEGTKMDPSDDLSILAGMKLLTLFVVVTIEISALDGHERGHLAPAKEPWKEGMPQYADNPDLWRSRAEEARAQAEQISDPLLRRKMLLVAESYERMGLRAEARLAQELSERGGVPSDRTGSQFVLPSPGALSFER